MPIRTPLISTATALAGIFAANFAGVWPMLGGHPYWSQSATYIGAGIGVVVFAALWFATIRLGWQVKYIAVTMLAVLVIAFVVSTLGKREFVGSYAENRLAGRIWYYGFVAFIAALLTSAAIGVQVVFGRR